MKNKNKFDTYDVKMMKRIFTIGIILATLYTIVMLLLYHLGI